MNNVNIEKSALLPILLENKEKYNQIYHSAVSGYWSKAEEVLNNKLNSIKNQEKIEPYLGLAFPENHEDDYNRAIKMVELSADNVLNLSQSEFNQYVLNDWTWRNTFLSVSSVYCSGVAVTGCYNKF